MASYASSPELRPDDEYEPGNLRHLVAGNRGRLLDPRRTPVSVVAVRAEVGFVDVRVEADEDAGAIWQVPLEEVDHYQFEIGAAQASDTAVEGVEAAIARVARDQRIAADETERARTEARIAERQAAADAWLVGRSRFLAHGHALPDPATRRGDPLLASDLEAHLGELGLWDVEEAFARSYVSNPGAGELVKGHRIVLAEMGLADYAGTIVRDPATFGGTWSRERRAEHIVARLAFLRALFARLGLDRLTLWRGLASDAPLRRREGRSLVSVSFAEEVARSHFDSRPDGLTRILVCRAVPVEQLFMSYHETSAMNTVFLEAEAVLLDRTGDGWP